MCTQTLPLGLLWLTPQLAATPSTGTASLVQCRCCPKGWLWLSSYHNVRAGTSHAGSCCQRGLLRLPSEPAVQSGTPSPLLPKALNVADVSATPITHRHALRRCCTFCCCPSHAQGIKPPGLPLLLCELQAIALWAVVDLPPAGTCLLCVCICSAMAALSPGLPEHSQWHLGGSSSLRLEACRALDLDMPAYGAVPALHAVVNVASHRQYPCPTSLCVAPATALCQTASWLCLRAP